jgi:hypothetical protein
LWVTRCAPHLVMRANVDFYTIHMEWLDWRHLWKDNPEIPGRNFLDLLNHASWLGCADHRDHIYAFLGHPFAQLDNGETTIVKPDYEKDTRQVFLELALNLLKEEKPLRLLSTVEHDNETIALDFPSWVPCWTVDATMCTLGIFEGFYYDASAGLGIRPAVAIDGRSLQVHGAILDTIFQVFHLPEINTIEDESTIPGRKALYDVWETVWDNRATSAYGEHNFWNAFSLTFTAGLSGYDCAEDTLSQHQAHFGAFWNLRLQPFHNDEPPPGFLELAERGDHEKYWLDMRQALDGRSFAITEKGHYVLGPMIMQPGDLCCVILGTKVPFILRRAEKKESFKLVGEAYIHGFMRGKAAAWVRNGTVQDEDFILC